jgi:putative transposase
MVKHAAEYRWSSAAAHCSLREDSLLSADFPPQGAIEDWADWLRTEENAEVVDSIRGKSKTGRPCGETVFLEAIEKRLGRTIRPKKAGRPSKKRNG